MSTNKLSAYLKVLSAYQPTPIPKHNELTFITKKTGIAQAFSWNEGETKQLTDFSDRVMDIHFSPCGKKAIVTSDYHGNEKKQLYMMDSDGSNVEELVVSKEHFHYFGGWSPNGDKVFYTSNRRNPGYFDVFIIDIHTKDVELIYKHDGNCTPKTWTNDGEHIIISMQETNTDNTLYLLHIHSGNISRIGPGATKARYKSVLTSKDGTYGFVLTDENTNTVGLYKFAIQDPQNLKKIIQIDKWDMEEIALSDDEKKLIFTVNEGGYSFIHLYDITNDSSSLLHGYPNGVINSLNWTNNHRFIFGLKSPIHPGDIWEYNISNHTCNRLTEYAQDSTYGSEWLMPTISSFQSFDGVEVPYFYYGENKKEKPTVIYVHGGPASQIKAEYNPVIQYLASEGFNVIAPNIRGSMGYGRKYLELDDRRKRMDAVTDLAELAEHLVKTGVANKGSVGIMGRSYGGFMVLCALTHFPEIWGAGVDIVGMSHLRTFLENTGVWRRRLREYEYGFLSEDTDFFDKIAPLNLTKQIVAPLQIFHGRNDTRVPVTESEQIYSDLKEQGKEVELKVFENEGHHTERIENHITMNEGIVRFLKDHLEHKR